MTRKVGTLVIGAGFAGLSTAYHLKQAGDPSVLIVERDRTVGAHASGNNAGMIRQAISDPFIGRLASDGRRALRKASRDGWKGLSYRENGSLLIAKGRALSELAGIASVLKRNRIPFRFLSPREAVRRVPVLQGADHEKGLFCPSDAFLDIDALMRGFAQRLNKSKVPIYYSHPIRTIRPVAGGFIVRAGKRTFRAQRVVNAAGAWAGELGRIAGASPMPFVAYRRHLYFAKDFKARDAAWPFVWDLSHELYFRPYGKELLLSACDKDIFRLREPRSGKTVERERTDPRVMELLKKKLKKFSPALAKARPGRSRVGLRTMASDNRFVVGEDPTLKGFFWVAGLGGHGVTTCFSVGRLAANLILRRPTDATIRRVLSPARFA